LVLAVFVVSTSLAGCGRATSIRVPAQSIPFIILVPESANNESIKKAYLNFWDLKNGKIIKTDKVIYTVAPSTDIISEQATYETSNGDRPLYWDGKDCIILPSFFKSVTNLYKRTETISEVPKIGEGLQNLSRVIFGKDIEIVRIPTGNSRDYKYTVKLWDGEKYIEKELNLNYEFQDTNSQPSYPVAIDNDGTNLNILVSGGYNPQTGMDLFLCTVDKKDWTSKWYKISVEDDAGIGPSNPPFSSNSIYFDGSFYVPSGCCSIAKVDIEERICKKWKKITTSKPSEEDISYGTSILGSFKDMTIVGFSVTRGGGNRYYICAFKNEENVGMMYLVNGNVNVMDKDGNILSNATLNENSSIIFPKMNGGM
jgi:hypothetical protein